MQISAAAKFRVEPLNSPGHEFDHPLLSSHEDVEDILASSSIRCIFRKSTKRKIGRMVAALNHFPFKGQIDKVTITLTAPDTDRAKEFKMNESELVD